MIKKYLYSNALLLACIGLQIGCTQGNTGQVEQAETGGEQKLVTLTEQNLEHGAAQYKVLMEKLPEGEFPKTYYAAQDKLETSGSDWWCSGFYPGALLYLYEETGDQVLYNEALDIMEHLKKEQYNTTTHDLGFMMYCSFGNAQRINPKPEYREILLNSAKSLASRYSPVVGSIRSWDFSAPEDYLVIIDNMMNLELLFWATKETGDSTYYNIAVDHANTTIENHYRPDYSSYHVVNYNTETGDIRLKRTEQGTADDSAWARGQAWGFYGFVVMYRETGDEQYLEQAKNIADFILNHPNMPEDKVPYWDFNAADIPDAPRDASAAAITASGLLELSTFVDEQAAERYLSAAETMIETLSTDTYRAEVGENGGFILKHGVGHLPKGSEIDVPLTYGDYYFIEANKRYKELKAL